ncbi:hypothetical protein CKA32_003034 [Geitlerinema sp. FC II]|nr:hypothetical protein CKA32_003034 [Geitlerinema sp. FC II]
MSQIYILAQSFEMATPFSEKKLNFFRNGDRPPTKASDLRN